MKRKHRDGEVVCRCRAYPFPHRMLGGFCTGMAFVLKFFDAQCWGECRGCMLFENEGDGCQVIQGKEPALQCSGLQEYVDYERIRLYGRNRKR